MESLQSLIDAREIKLDCPACGSVCSRALAWVRSRREMNCPSCEAVIVLGTSKLRAQIRALERQLSELHNLLRDQIKR